MAVSTSLKVSRPVIYALVGALCVGAYLYLTNPDQSATPTKHRATTKTTTVIADADGITAADYNAHFPRYPGSGRNPYVPGILSASQQNASAAAALGAGSGGLGGKAGGAWTLTGVNVINGIASALIESSSGDSVTLQKGDQWHGLRVTSLSGDAVTFTNALGQTTELSFDSGTSAGANPTAPAVPSLSQIRPLPPLTVSAPAAVTPVATPAVSSFGASFRSRRRSAASNSSDNNNTQNSNQNNGNDNGGPPDDGGGPGGGGPGGGGPGGGGPGGPPPD